MATYKGKLEQKTGTNTSDVLYPETSADQAVYDNTTSGLTATNVQAAIDEIKAAGVGVTGVKGNAETNYRTGNVNLTPGNIGAEAAFTDGSATIASVSSDIVTIKAGVAQSGGAISNSTGADITLAKAAKTGSYTDLTDKPTIGNGTLTIQVEGTQKGTFTANQTGNGTINITAADLGLSSALKFIGQATTTVPSAGNYIKTQIGSTTYYISVTDSGTAAEVAANKGEVIVVGAKEYVCTTGGVFGTNVFTELGDESSYALKSILISAGTGLTGGGSLEANRTLSLADGYGDTKNPYSAKTKNTVLAGPSTGSDAAPTFRALVSADIPDLSSIYLTGNETITTTINSGKKADGSTDITGNGSGTTSINVTLGDSGVTAGTYSAVSVNAKGIVTEGTQVFVVIPNNGNLNGVAQGGLVFRKNA